MRTTLPHHICAGLVGVGLGFGAAPAFAQDLPPPTVNPEDGSGLEEIIVTAQRRSERLQDVPISVSTLGADLARDIGVNAPSDLSVAVPAVTFQTTVNGGGITIRGVGGTFGIGDEPPNAIYVDGVYQASAPAFLSGFNNIERIEVLKGPQGTLFGRNASGGVVQVVTRKPSHDTGLEAMVGYGNFDTMEGSLYATTGLSERLAVDLAIAARDMGDGWGHNFGNGRDAYRGNSLSARSKLLWDVDDHTDVTLIGLYSKAKPAEAQGGQIWPGYVDRAGGTGRGFYNTNTNEQTGYTIEQIQGSLTVNHSAPWADLISITSYDYTRNYRSIYDQDGSPLNLLAFQVYLPFRTWTQEFRIQSLSGSSINWILGAYIFDNETEAAPITVRGAAAAGFGGAYNFESSAPTQSVAGFGQLTVPLTERTQLTLGARYTIDDKSLDIEVNSVNSGGAPIPLPFSSNPRHDHRTDEKLTYRLALDHKFSDDVMAYASYSTGFKSGAYGLVALNPAATTAAGAFAPPVTPQTVDAYEAGIKSELLDRRLRLNLAGFYYDFNNIQLRRVVPGGTVLLNAGTARMKGVDADITWQASSAFSIQGALSYLDGKYSDFPNPPYFRPTVNAAGVATGGLTQFTGVNAKGNRTVNSPEWVASLIGNLAIPTSFGEVGVVGSYEYNDGYYFDAQNLFKSPSRNLLNLTTSWTSPDGSYEISGWVKNILSEKYIGSNNISALGPLYWAAAPRTYGVRLRVTM